MSNLKSDCDGNPVFWLSVLTFTQLCKREWGDKMEKTLAYIFYIMQVKEQNVLVALKKGHFMLSFH